MNKLGSTILRYDRLASTNDAARDLASTGADEGLAVIAYEQTAGRGSQGRSWSSPAGEGLYISVILRPEMKPSDSAILTLASAIAVAETISQDFGAAVDIKWPNDILASGKKICGILVESAIEADRLQHAIVGIGVNLLQREFAEEIRESATSLVIESGRAVSPDQFSVVLLDRLDRWYKIAVDSPEEVIARWRELSSYASGCAVQIESGGETIEAITRGLTPTGALVIETMDGARREIVSGEIRLRKTVGGRLSDAFQRSEKL